MALALGLHGCGVDPCANDHLPDWPDLPRLKSAGLIKSENVAELVFQGAFAVGGMVPFLLEILAFHQAGNVFGVSFEMIVLQFMATTLQAAGSVLSEAPKIVACRDLSPFMCAVNTMTPTQQWTQAIGTIVCFLAYMRYLPKQSELDALTPQETGSEPSEADPSEASCGAAQCFTLDVLRRNAHTSAWLAFGVVMIAATALMVPPFVLGPCASIVFPLNLGIIGLATVFQAFIGVPQIILLYKLRDHGALSISAIAIQAVGCAILTVTFYQEGALWLNFLGPVCCTLEMTIILMLIAYFWYERRLATSKGTKYKWGPIVPTTRFLPRYIMSRHLHTG